MTVARSLRLWVKTDISRPDAMHSAESGIVPVPGVEIKLSRTPGCVARRASLLGEDYDSIYGTDLGYNAEDLEKFREQKII